MTLFLRITSVVIGISAVLTFYTALLHLSRKDHRSYRFRILRDFVVGFQTLQLYFIANSFQFTYPFLLYPFVTLLFISGSLNYIRYFHFFYPTGKNPFRSKLFLLPVVFIFAGETWFYIFNYKQSRFILYELFASPLTNPISLIILAGVLVQMVQYVLLLRMESGFLREEKIREPVLVSSIIMIVFIIDNILITTGFLISSHFLMTLGILLMGITGIIYLLFENRYPHFYQLVAREDRQVKYRKSIIQGVNKELIKQRLDELMKEEKIYRDIELKLDDVASMLLITPHQLSEFVNDWMGMNFSSFINQFRVEEAKHLLQNNPDQSNLSIAFQVGFGSKQTFNKIFKEQTTMTPTEYKKIYGK